MCKRCKSKPINSPKKNNWTTIRLFVSAGTRGILNDDSHFAIFSFYLARQISLIVFLYNYSVCLSLDCQIFDQSQFGKSHWVRHHWTHGACYFAPHLSHCRNVVDCEKKIGSSEREIAPTCRLLIWIYHDYTELHLDGQNQKHRRLKVIRGASEKPWWMSRLLQIQMREAQIAFKER